MYCANCGVKLSDNLSECPLCGTRAYHPDIDRKCTEGQYPRDKYPEKQKRNLVAQSIFSILYLLPLLIVPLCDIQINGQFTWSGYVTGAVVLSYVILVLPTWFAKPNMVIFVPCDFATAALYLLYINFATGGNWFLSLALPVTGGFALITTAAVVLTKYVPKGNLYTFGGAFILTGAFMVLVEWLINLTFSLPKFIGWSLYPLIVLVILGCLLIYLAINRSAREMLERKIFL